MLYLSPWSHPSFCLSPSSSSGYLTKLLVYRRNYYNSGIGWRISLCCIYLNPSLGKDLDMLKVVKLSKDMNDVKIHLGCLWRCRVLLIHCSWKGGRRQRILACHSVKSWDLKRSSESGCVCVCVTRSAYMYVLWVYFFVLRKLYHIFWGWNYIYNSVYSTFFPKWM